MFGSTCPICGSGDLVHNIDYVDPVWQEVGIFNNLTISYCVVCGFGFSVPELAEHIVEQFYVAHYRDKRSPHHIDFEKCERLFCDHRSLAQILLAKRFTSFDEGDRFLDIGPGSGASFFTAANILNKPQCAAIELTQGAEEAYGRIYGIRTFKTVRDYASHGLKAKICLLSHSLEHYKVSQLETALADLRLAVSDDGIIVVEVPHMDMRLHAALRSGDSPHFLFFSSDSLRELFVLHGWEVLFVNTCAEPYDKWWIEKAKAKTLQSLKFNSVKNDIKSVAKMCLSRLPLSVRAYLRKICQKSILVDWRNDQFAYGGDRTCLRLVAKPSPDSGMREGQTSGVSTNNP